MRLILSAAILSANATSMLSAVAQPAVAQPLVAQAGGSQDYRYKIETLFEGVPQPMQFQIAPDGRIIFIEIQGKVRIFHPDSKLMVDAGSIPVYLAQENGLIGMALDPGFAVNHWIYLLHSPVDFKGQHISRYTMEGDKLNLASEKILITYEEQREQCCHHAGCLRFGPDGCLYFSTGDNTNPFDSDGFSPIDLAPGRSAWDANKSAANTNDLRGKINRIKPTPAGGYTIPPGNLFPPGTPKTRPEIYVMGCRNPWRFNFNPKTGTLYYGDVGNDSHGDSAERGPQGYDLINQVKKPAFFGWPLFRGNNAAYSAYDFERQKAGARFDPAHPINVSPNNTGLRDLPAAQPGWIFYPYGKSPEFPELGEGGRTACGGPVFHWKPEFEKSGGFPKKYDNCLLISDWQRPFLKWVRLDEEEKLVAIEPFTSAVALLTSENKGDLAGAFPLRRPVDMAFDGSGALYIFDYGTTWGANKDSRLIKITYQSGNIAPVAKATAKPGMGREPLTVELSSAGTKDLDGDAVTYTWSLQPGGKVISTEPNPKVVLSGVGNYVVELRVRDVHGGVGFASVPLVVGNSPPELRFDSPLDGDFFTPGKPQSFKLAVKDAEDGKSEAKPAEFGARTILVADWFKGDGKQDIPAGLSRMKESDCFACHAVDQQVVGPALVAIAEKYRSKSGAAEASIQRVLKGSTGVWGQVAMLPHAQHTADEISMMVAWIYTLEKGAGGPALVRGLSGEITAPVDGAVRKGVLEASYTDTGRAPAGALSTKASVHLISRRCEAEAGVAVEGAQSRNQKGASGNQSLQVIAAGNSFKFPALNLKGSTTATCRVACDKAGRIELRAGSKTGELLATFEIASTGGAEKWEEFSVPLKVPAAARGDVYIVFQSADSPVKGDLMDLDWIQFNAL